MASKYIIIGHCCCFFWQPYDIGKRTVEYESAHKYNTSAQDAGHSYIIQYTTMEIFF